MRVLNESKAVYGLLLAAILLTLPLFAQEFRGTITGNVLDPSGAAVPNARIEARNTGTVSVAIVQSNGTGAYTIPFLAPGTYKLTVNAAGFKQAIQDGIELHVGDRLQIDLKLQVGASSESITVTAEVEQLRTATASMGQTIN